MSLPQLKYSKKQIYVNVSNTDGIVIDVILTIEIRHHMVVDMDGV